MTRPEKEFGERSNDDIIREILPSCDLYPAEIIE